MDDSFYDALSKVATALTALGSALVILYQIYRSKAAANTNNPEDGKGTG